MRKPEDCATAMKRAVYCNKVVFLISITHRRKLNRILFLTFKILVPDRIMNVSLSVKA